MKISFFDFTTWQEMDDKSMFSFICSEIKKILENDDRGKKYTFMDMKDSDPDLIIGFITMKMLNGESEILKLLTQKKNENLLRPIACRQSNCPAGHKYNYKPILFISTDPINDFDYSKQKNGTPCFPRVNLDPRKLYLDSSIWNRHLYISDPDFPCKLENLVAEILEYHELDLYKTNVAREFLEFETRMMVNSYLAPVFNGHSRFVTPFKFHSEGTMQRQLDLPKEPGGMSLRKSISEYRWHILVIDDFCNKPLSREGGKESDVLTKAQIICRLFNKKLAGKCLKDCDHCKVNKEYLEKYGYYTISNATFPKDTDDYSSCTVPFLITAANSVANAEKALIEVPREHEKCFDVILLDYLLDSSESTGTNGESNHPLGNRNSGLDILMFIKNTADKQINHPMKKQWIFPISAFSSAMLNELREGGFSHHDEKWELASGADPVNAPNLFLPKFCKFLHVQINEICELRHMNAINEEIMNYDKSKLSDRDTHVDDRGFFEQIYPSYLMLKTAYESIYINVKRSYLYYSIYVKNYGRTSFNLWEHFQHLTYLVAFGNRLEWAKMWEEYTYINRRLNAEIPDRKDSKLSLFFHSLMERYRDYINTLYKNASK